MAKLSIVQRKWWLSVHIVFAALWTGTVLSMFLLSWRNTSSENGEVLSALNAAINLLDDFVVIPAAIGSVITATVLCWGTNYGFTKFYWVISKWLLSSSLIIFGTFWLFPWGNYAEKAATETGIAALQDTTYGFDARGVLYGTLAQVVFLLIIIGISVLKPWGRKATAQRSSES